MSTRGWEGVTRADVTKRELAQRAARMPQKARSKYGAVKTTVDGIVFDSKREAARYVELKALERAGQLHRLTLQKPLALCVPAKHAPADYTQQKIGTYVADFVYCTCDTPATCTGAAGVVEDVKGFHTPLYKWKKRHVEVQYGIQIREIR